MKLKQTVTINGSGPYVNTENCIFGQFMMLQGLIHELRPDLEPNWLQRRPDLLTIMGTLFHCGRVNLFSLEDKLDVRIVWEFVPQRPALLASSSTPSTQSAPPPTPDFEQI
jgi:hypothetical protein